MFFYGPEFEFLCEALDSNVVGDVEELVDIASECVADYFATGRSRDILLISRRYVITAQCVGVLVSSPYVSLEYRLRRAKDRYMKTSSSSRSCRLPFNFLEDVNVFLQKGLWRSFREFKKDVLESILSLRRDRHLEECVLQRSCSDGHTWLVSIGWMRDELQPRDNMSNVWGFFLIEFQTAALRRSAFPRRHPAGILFPTAGTYNVVGPTPI